MIKEVVIDKEGNELQGGDLLYLGEEDISRGDFWRTNLGRLMIVEGSKEVLVEVNLRGVSEGYRLELKSGKGETVYTTEGKGTLFLKYFVNSGGRVIRRKVV